MQMNNFGQEHHFAYHQIWYVTSRHHFLNLQEFIGGINLCRGIILDRSTTLHIGAKLVLIMIFISIHNKLRPFLYNHYCIYLSLHCFICMFHSLHDEIFILEIYRHLLSSIHGCSIYRQCPPVKPTNTVTTHIRDLNWIMNNNR